MMTSPQDNKGQMPGHCPTPPITSASIYGAQHGRHVQQGSTSPSPSSAFFPAQCSTGSFSNYGSDPQSRTPPTHPSLMRPAEDNANGQNLNAGFGFDTKYLEDYLKVIESFQGGAGGDTRNYYDSRNFYDANRSLQSLADTFNYMYANSLRSSVGNNYPPSNQQDSYVTSRSRSVGLPPMQQPMSQSSLRHSDLHSSQTDLRHSGDNMQMHDQNDFTGIHTKLDNLHPKIEGVQPKMEMPEPPDTPNHNVHALPPMSSASCRLNMNTNNVSRQSNYLDSNSHMEAPRNGTVSDHMDNPPTPSPVPHGMVKKMSPPVQTQADTNHTTNSQVETKYAVSANNANHTNSNNAPIKLKITVPPITSHENNKDCSGSEDDSDIDDVDLSEEDVLSEASDPDDVADSDMSSENGEELDDDLDEDEDVDDDIKDEPEKSDLDDTDDEKTDIEDYSDLKRGSNGLLTEIKEEVLDSEGVDEVIPSKRRRGRKAKPQRVIPAKEKKRRGRPPKDGVVPKERTVKKGRRKGKGTKICEKCGRKFERNDTYQRHLLQHDTIKMFECNVCGCKYERQEHLTRHHRSHTGVTYRCGYCDVSFKQQRPYRDHMLSLHGQKKPFICTYPGCLFRAATPSRVEKHAEIHGPEKHYKCEKCGRDFAQVNGLRSHQRSCYEKRQYLCDFCGAKFNFLGSLKSHRYIHTGEKPYACSECDARFTDHRNLRRHRLIHENAYPYPCEFCDKKFRHSNSLKAHNKMHQNCTQWDRPPEVHPSQHPGPMPAMEYLLANVMNQATMNQAAMNPATC